MCVVGVTKRDGVIFILSFRGSGLCGRGREGLDLYSLTEGLIVEAGTVPSCGAASGFVSVSVTFLLA
jgi:hypothetical protein